MTQEFKENLLKYVIGIFPNEEPKKQEVIKKIREIPSSDWDGFIPNNGNTTAVHIEGIIYQNEQAGDLSIIYGGYSTGSTSDLANGFIILLDSNLKPLKLFEKFNNDTQLRYIQQMNISDDGTFFAIDDILYSFDNPQYIVDSTKRFIMLNNFTTKIDQVNDYILNLQKSYILPENCKNFYCKYLVKNPNSSHYYMSGARANNIGNTWDFDSMGCIELKVNVGSENEWNFFGTSVGVTGEGIIYGGSYAEFDENDNLFFEIIGCLNNANLGQIYLYIKDFNQTCWTKQTVANFTHGYYINSYILNGQCVFKNKFEVYFVLSNERWSRVGELKEKYIGLYKYSLNTSSFMKIFEESLGKAERSYKRQILLANSNNEIYILYCVDDNQDGIGDYYFFRFEDTWNPILIMKDRNFRHQSELFFVKSNYNLLQAFILKTTFNESYWNQILLKENYNYLKYNSYPYINQSSLNSDNVEIYSNEDLVFARNLYNKTINNNTTVSTVEIPNTYLNDIDLTSQQLLSKTNLTLIDDTDIVRKNIYETVFLNFINTIRIIDKNSDIQLLNEQASSYLNHSINVDTAYDKAKFHDKVIIYYQDGTTKEIAYELQEINSVSSNIIFALYTDKKVQSAEIISNDKTTIYQIIDLSNLELFKNYKISQRLEVI